MLLRLNIGSQAQNLIKHDKRSARNITVIARMPEDRQTNYKQTTVTSIQSHIHLCVHPVSYTHLRAHETRSNL
eukprot:14603331-Heterocapsa_arctica.AAC.1